MSLFSCSNCNRHEEAINEIRNKIIDLIVEQDIEIKERHDTWNQYVDFEIGRASGYR